MSRLFLDYVNTLCAVTGAAAAVAIPLVLHSNAERSRENDNVIAKETRTLQVMDDLDHKISVIVGTKVQLDHKNQVPDELAFSSPYIDHPDNRAVQLQVFRLLNIYDFVCLGAKEGLFSEDIIEQMRGDALRQTWADYGSYITAHRKAKPSTARAWDNCDDWVARTTASR
jgi:Domain of unknown function (DUF4760)